MNTKTQNSVHVADNQSSAPCGIERQLLQQAMDFARAVWMCELNKADREGLAFNLKSAISDYFRGIAKAAPAQATPLAVLVREYGDIMFQAGYDNRQDGEAVAAESDSRIAEILRAAAKPLT